jgi:cephalosporin-C deacetylase-like acetyl esterase
MRVAMANFAQVCLIFASTIELAAELIVPSADLPTSNPWDLTKLSTPPVFEWIDKSGPVRSLYYEGEPYRGNRTRVFAYFATPETVGRTTVKRQRFSAVVLLHGGGGTAYREWVEIWAKRGYAAIAMDLTGCQPIDRRNAHEERSRLRLTDGGPDLKDESIFGSVDKAPTEQWPYHAVAAAVRAHSLIRSFPEVDAENTAVTGISWGGYLTLIVAAVDNRFKAAVPVYGCGFLHENSAWLGDFAKMSAQQRDRWVKLWDPSVYLPAVKMPVFFVNGTNDVAYPLDSYMKSYDAVSGTKQLRITVNMPHSHRDGWAPNEIGLFIDQFLRGGRALPSVSELKNVEGKMVLKCNCTGKVAAKLHFTNDHGPMNGRAWHTRRATVLNERVVADAPSGEATAWFFSFTDDHDATVTSKVFFKERTSTAISSKN